MQQNEPLSTNKTFSSEWWKDFLLQSNGMKDAARFSGALTAEKVESFNEELKVLLGRAASGNKFRIYIDGIQQEGEIINNSLPSRDESLTAWVKRSFQGKKFGMIINQCEQLSEYLAAHLFQDLLPLHDHAGIPLKGYNITIFLGNYGFTPLGIHQDGPGNNVLHYHLGPSEKIMYNWNEEHFSKLTSLPREQQLHLADKFTIKSGDLYYMPWNKYHLGYTGEFSVGITVWFNNPTRFSFLRSLFDESIKDGNEEAILSDDLFASVRDKGSFLKNVVNAESPSDTIENLLYSCFNSERLKLSSNAYWNSKSLAEHNRQLSKDDLEKLVTIVNPYKIQHEIKDNYCCLYYRGHKSILKNEIKLIHLIEKFNNREKLSVAAILKYLSPELTARETIIFLTDLYQKQSITLD